MYVIVMICTQQYVIPFTFQLNSYFIRGFTLGGSSGQAVVRCRPFPPVRALIFIAHKVHFNIPTARRFSSKVANSRSRAFR